MFANMGIGSLILIVLLVVLLFGTKKLRGLGSDLGSAIKGFKKSMDDDSNNQDAGFDEPAERVGDKRQQANDVEKPEVKEKS